MLGNVGNVSLDMGRSLDDGHHSFVACTISSPSFEKHGKVFASVSAVTSILSILGAGSVIVYAIVNKIVRNPEVRPLFHLALANFFLAALWLTGSIRWLVNHNRLSSCFYLDVVAEMFHLASFFLTVNYGLNVYVRLKEKTFNINNLQFSTVSSSRFYTWLFRTCYLFSWLAPVAILFPLIIYESDPEKDQYVKCSRCLLLFDRPKPRSSDLKQLWALYGSIAMASSLTFSIVALLVLYLLTIRVYRKAIIRSGVLTDRQRTSIDNMQQRIFLYILVFLICWSPALVVASADLDPRRIHNLNMGKWFALFVLQGLTAPMQGFLNSIVYGWTRKSFRQASERQGLLDSVQSSGRSSYGSVDRYSL